MVAADARAPAQRARGAAETRRSAHALWARGGARWRAGAWAGATGAIAPGCRADLVVLDADDPALAEQAADDVLDAAIFGPCRAPVRDVMVGGAWVVRDGHHRDEDAIFARYRATLRTLAA